MMKIIIGGDVAPTKTNEDLFCNGEIEKLIGLDMLKILYGADIRIFNIEVPLTDCNKSIKKCGPALAAPTKTILGIKKFAPDLVTLANNHCMDKGIEGLRTAMQLLKENGIVSIGAGENIFIASKPHILECEGVKVGVYACAEHEFSIATKNSGGANPFNPYESLDHINELSTKCDFVIVLFHGGKVGYQYPTPELQKVCQKMVDKGANLVVLQHSHCVGCYEKYNDGTIVYGQGNLLFDYGEDRNPKWDEGLLIQIEIDEERKDIHFVPVERKNNLVRIALKDKGDNILEAFYKRSKEIETTGFIQEEYKKYVKNVYFSLYGRMLGKFTNNIVFFTIEKLTRGKIWQFIFKDSDYMLIWNYLNCESIREVLSEGAISQVHLIEGED